MRSLRQILVLAAAAAVALAAIAIPANAANVVAHYVLNGDANDSSPNAYHGVVSGGVTFIADANRGTVVSFDGVDGKIDVGASGYAITENGIANAQFAIGFWIKPTIVDADTDTKTDVNVLIGGSDHGVIEIVGDGSWNNFGLSSGSVGVNSGGGNGSGGKVPSIDLYDGDWHHVFMQWVDPDGTVAGGDGASAELWIDGLAATMGSKTYNGNGDVGNMQLGGNIVMSNGGRRYYTGLMSDVYFMDDQLTGQEVIDAFVDPANDTTYTWVSDGTTGTTAWDANANWSSTGPLPPDNANQAAVIVGNTNTQATVDLAGNSYSIHNITFTGDVDTTVTGTGTLSFGEAGKHSADIIVSHGSVATQASEISCPVTLNNTAYVAIADAGDQLTISGAIDGAGGLSLTSSNAGTLVLSSANTNTGDTTIDGGTLKLGDALALQNSAVTVNSGGTLDVNALDATLGGLTGDGGIDLGSTTLSVGNNNASITYSGALSGTGGVTKIGSGTQTLDGASTNTGATTVSSGTLAVGSLADGGAASPIGAAATDAANLVLGGGTTLQYTGTGDSTDRLFTLAGNATIYNSGSGELNFTNTGAMAYGTVDQARKLTSYRATGTVTTIAADIADNGAGAVSVDAGITDNRVYGTTVLTGTNTYTGDTTIIYGALRADDGVGLPTNSKLVFKSNRYEADTGVLETQGTFNRTIGNTSTGVYWSSSGTARAGGGFAAYGGDLTVSLVTGLPGNAIDWSSDANGFNDKGLGLGSRTATHQVELTNDLVLNGGTRTITTFASATASALLSGDISDGSAVSKLSIVNGSGYSTSTMANVKLAGNNTFSGGMALSAVTLTATDPNQLGTKTGTNQISFAQKAHLNLLADGSVDFKQNLYGTSNYPQTYIHVDHAPGGSDTNGTHSVGNIGFSNNNDAELYVTGDNGYGLSIDDIVSIRRQKLYNDAPGTVTIASMANSYKDEKDGYYKFYGTGTTVVEGPVTGHGGYDNPTLDKYDGGTLILNGTNTCGGNTTVRAGTMLVNGSCDNSAVTVSNSAGATFGGGGSVKSLTMNGGNILAPGASVGTLDVVGGNASLGAGTVYEWQFDGTGDKVTVDGDLTLTDGWVLKLIDAGGTPNGSTKYDLFTFTGNFTGSTDGGDPDLLTNFVLNTDEVSGWGDLGGAQVVLDLAATTPRVYITGLGTSALDGDADGNGVVNAADYMALKRHMGTSTGATLAMGNFDGDTDVDFDDLQVLIDNYGTSLSPASPVVPEPATLFVLLAAGLPALLKRRRSRS